MAIFDTTWYLNYGNGSSTGYYATAQWTALTSYTVGQMVRQLATPAVGSERIFVCIIAGTTLASEPSWTLTYGAKTAEAAGPTWMEVTGRSAVNGDQTLTWASVKNKTIVIGQAIYDSGSSSVQICTTAGTTGNGSTPSFSGTAGTTTADNTVTWTSLGAASNFTAWLAPHARISIVAGTGFMAAGNICYVASAHAETQASALSFPQTNSTVLAPFQFISTGTSVAPPTSVSAGASVSTTGANAITLSAITSNASVYFYGISFNSGSGSSVASILISNSAFVDLTFIFDTCTFTLNNTATTSVISINNMSSPRTAYVEFRGCSFLFGNTSQQITLAYGKVKFIGGSLASTGTVPSTAFGVVNQRPGPAALVMDMDISAVTGTLIALSSQTPLEVIFENCKLGSGVTLPSAINLLGGSSAKIHNCDSAATNYRYYYSGGFGVIQQETTIVRTGSLATDGTTPISWNFTTSTTPTFYLPFVSEEISVWNDTTGSTVTITLYLISNTTLNNNDFWAEAEYAGTSSFPLGLTVNSRMTLLGTPAALTSDSSTWGGSTNKYKIVMTCTPQNKGPIKVRFYKAKPSVTTYIDPYIYLS